MGTTKMANIDLVPVPGTSVTVHVPSGQSANVANHPTDFPSVTPGATLPSGGKAVKVTIQATQGQAIRFANPSIIFF